MTSRRQAVLICASLSLLSGIALLMLQQPIHKTGVLGMGLLSAWLVPVIDGGVLASETAKSNQPRRLGVFLSWTAVCLVTAVSAWSFLASLSDILFGRELPFPDPHKAAGAFVVYLLSFRETHFAFVLLPGLLLLGIAFRKGRLT